MLTALPYRHLVPLIHLKQKGASHVIEARCFYCNKLMQVVKLIELNKNFDFEFLVYNQSILQSHHLYRAHLFHPDEKC